MPVIPVRELPEVKDVLDKLPKPGPGQSGWDADSILLSLRGGNSADAVAAKFLELAKASGFTEVGGATPEVQGQLQQALALFLLHVPAPQRANAYVVGLVQLMFTKVFGFPPPDPPAGVPVVKPNPQD